MYTLALFDGGKVYVRVERWTYARVRHEVAQPVHSCETLLHNGRMIGWRAMGDEYWLRVA